MPLYEYECESCGRRFERIQKFSDPPPATCPNCGGPVRKLFSSPAIQFKGSGFYITDYARAGKSAEGGGEGAGSDKASTDKPDSAKGNEAGAATPASTKTDSSKSDSSTGESSKPAASPKPESTPKTSGKSGSD